MTWPRPLAAAGLFGAALAVAGWMVATPGNVNLSNHAAPRADGGPGLLAHLPFVVRDAAMDQIGPGRPTLTPEVPAELPELSVLAQVGGSPLDVALSGDLAYVAGGTTVRVVNIANPEHPRFLGQSPPLPGLAMAVAVRGTRAYVALSDGHASRGSIETLPDSGVTVLDLTDPVHPRLLRTLPFPGGATDLLLHGDFLFVATGNLWWDEEDEGSVRVLDISSAEAPREVATIPGTAWRLTIEDERLYVGDGVFDISDPTQPLEVDGVPDLFRHLDQAVRGNDLASVGANFPGDDLREPVRVNAIDGSQPEREVGCQGGGGLLAVTWLQDRLLAVGAGGGCTVAVPPNGDLSVRQFDTRAAGTAVTVRGQIAFVAAMRRWERDSGFLSGGGLLSVLDFADPDRPRQVGWLDGPTAETIAVAGAGDRIYLLEGESVIREEPVTHRLWVLDASNPSSPVPLGSLEMSSATGYGLAESGGHVFVATSGGLDVFDLRDPASPRPLAHLDGGFSEHPLPRAVVRAGYLYVLGEMLRVFDVTDPAQPREVSTPLGPVICDDLVIESNGRAFLLDAMSGTVTPLLLGSQGIERVFEPLQLGKVQSIAGSRDHLFALRRGESGGRLSLDAWTVDASMKPQLAGTLTDFPGSPWEGRIVADGDRLHLMTPSTSVTAIDITEPSRPRVVARLQNSTFDRVLYGGGDENSIVNYWDLVPWNGMLLRSRESGGLDILQAP